MINTKILAEAAVASLVENEANGIKARVKAMCDAHAANLVSEMNESITLGNDALNEGFPTWKVTFSTAHEPIEVKARYTDSAIKKAEKLAQKRDPKGRMAKYKDVDKVNESTLNEWVVADWNGETPSEATAEKITKEINSYLKKQGVSWSVSSVGSKVGRRVGMGHETSRPSIVADNSVSIAEWKAHQKAMKAIAKKIDGAAFT